jgi:peptidoglycan hydrolase-like protein with peptidoglycan-binding domain
MPGSASITITVNAAPGGGGGGGGGGGVTVIYKFPTPPVVSTTPIVNPLPAGLTKTSIPALGVKKGISSAKDIISLQLFLNWNLGSKLVPQLKVDGKFGNALTSAIRLFQRSNNLTVDGVFGRGNALLATSILAGTNSSPTQLPPVTSAGKPNITIPTIGIKKGVNDTRANVITLQTFLNWYVKPNPLLKVDGNWGIGTTNAIRLFQTKVGAKADGSFGPNTAGKAIEALR